MGGLTWRQEAVLFIGRAQEQINRMRLDLETHHGFDHPGTPNEARAFDCLLHNLEDDCRTTGEAISPDAKETSDD